MCGCECAMRCMWVCREQFLMCVCGHTCTCTHNLRFPDGFDDEEEDEEEEEEGEVSESELEGMAPTPKRRKLARETALSNLGFFLYFRGIECSIHDTNPSVMGRLN